MRRLLRHAAIILSIACIGPSALAQQNPIEPTNVEFVAAFSGAVIGAAKACGIEASLLDAATEHVFRVVRAKARDNAEVQSAKRYFTGTYNINVSRGNSASDPPDCSKARAMFAQWDSILNGTAAK